MEWVDFDKAYEDRSNGRERNLSYKKGKTVKHKTAKLAAEDATEQNRSEACRMTVRRKSGKARRHGESFSWHHWLKNKSGKRRCSSRACNFGKKVRSIRDVISPAT